MWPRIQLDCDDGTQCRARCIVGIPVKGTQHRAWCTVGTQVKGTQHRIRCVVGTRVKGALCLHPVKALCPPYSCLYQTLCTRVVTIMSSPGTPGTPHFSTDESGGREKRRGRSSPGERGPIMKQESLTSGEATPELEATEAMWPVIPSGGPGKFSRSDISRTVDKPDVK